MMAVTAIMAGLLPILWGSETGASVMKRIDAPMVGGMISSTVLTLVLIPALYSLWKEHELLSLRAGDDASESSSPEVPALLSGDRGSELPGAYHVSET